jgi:hypothetical protein
MTSTQRAGRALLGIATAFSFFLDARQAQATYDPIGSGQTTLRFARSFLATLRQNGVRLSATAPARLGGTAATFPIAAGKLDPVSVRGSLEHAGALVFTAGKRALPMKDLQLKTTQARSPLAAKFGGGKLKLAASSKLATERSGFGLRARVSSIRLSAKVATRLDKKLGLRGVFREGELLGSAVTDAEPATVAIASAGKAELSLDPAFQAKLASLFVAVNPIFPTEHPGAFTLPIGAGALAPDAASGTLKTGGALEFIQVGGGQFFLRELEPDLGTHLANGESQLILAAGGPGPTAVGSLFGLGAGTASSEPAARTISLAGAALTLQAGVAQAFNEAFAKPQGKSNVFVAGETLGAITFTAQAE